MRKVSLLVGLSTMAILPLYGVSSYITNSSKQTYEEQVQAEFQYDGTQTITYSFDQENGPKVVATENIQVIDINPGNNLSFDNFYGINITLTGVDKNYLVDVSSPTSHQEVYTEVVWAKDGLTRAQVDQYYPWYDTQEKEAAVGKTVYTLQYWDEAKDDTPPIYIGEIPGKLWDIVRNNVPIPHANPLNNVNVSFAELLNQDSTSANKKLWKQSWIKTATTYSLASTYTMYSVKQGSGQQNPSREYNTYNGHDYWAWLNYNFMGWGEANFTNASQASGGHGGGTLNYEIKLIDQNMKSYTITKGIAADSTKKVSLDELVVDGSFNIVPVTTTEAKMTFVIDQQLINTVDLRNYNMQMRVVYKETTPATLASETEWANFKNPDGSTYQLIFGTNTVYFNVDTTKTYHVEMRDANDPTVVITTDDIFKKYVPASKWNTAAFVWGMVSLAIVVIVFGGWYFTWFFMNRAKKRSKGWNPFSKNNYRTWYLTKNKNFNSNNKEELKIDENFKLPTE